MYSIKSTNEGSDDIKSQPDKAITISSGISTPVVEIIQPSAPLIVARQGRLGRKFINDLTPIKEQIFNNEDYKVDKTQSLSSVLNMKAN